LDALNSLSLSSIALRLALSMAAMAAGWWLLGPIGLVTTSPIPAFLLAGPILAMALGAIRAAKTLSFQSVEGVYYTFRGVPVPVWEDDLEQRWIAVAAIRTVLPSFPRDAVLQRVFPSGVITALRGVGSLVRADELIEFLSKAQQADAVKFKNWVQREVYYPSGSARKSGATPTSPSNVA
jgi:hypothetical protein